MLSWERSHDKHSLNGLVGQEATDMWERSHNTMESHGCQEAQTGCSEMCRLP